MVNKFAYVSCEHVQVFVIICFCLVYTVQYTPNRSFHMRYSVRFCSIHLILKRSFQLFVVVQLQIEQKTMSNRPVRCIFEMRKERTIIARNLFTMNNA